MKDTVDGLVIKEMPYGENDKLITVLTARYGQMVFLAKGARSLRSKILPVCRLFTYANFEYYERGERRWVSGGSPNESFFSLSSELSSHALACYIVSVAAEITGEGVEAEEILRVTLNTLYAISKGLRPLAQIKAIYELYAARVSGLEPDVYSCAECGCTDAAQSWLDVMNGFVVCDECHAKRSSLVPRASDTADVIADENGTRSILCPLDASALTAMRYVLSADVSRLFSFRLTSEESMELFARAAETYLVNHLERNFEALDFYKSIK